MWLWASDRNESEVDKIQLDFSPIPLSRACGAPSSSLHKSTESSSAMTSHFYSHAPVRMAVAVWL